MINMSYILMPAVLDMKKTYKPQILNDYRRTANTRKNQIKIRFGTKEENVTKTKLEMLLKLVRFS